MNDIREFAEKYYKLYSDSKTRDHEVDGDFAQECFGFRFKMDCGNKFQKAYGKSAFYDPEELKKVIQNVDDVETLGSAILSRWRYVTHWSNEDLLDKRNRMWFTTAFKHLMELVE